MATLEAIWVWQASQARGLATASTQRGSAWMGRCIARSFGARIRLHAHASSTRSWPCRRAALYVHLHRHLQNGLRLTGAHLFRLFILLWASQHRFKSGPEAGCDCIIMGAALGARQKHCTNKALQHCQVPQSHIDNSAMASGRWLAGGGGGLWASERVVTRRAWHAPDPNYRIVNRTRRGSLLRDRRVSVFRK